MVRDGRGVQIRLVVVVALAVIGLAYIGLRLWTGQGHLMPSPPWAGAVLLGVMAVGVYLAALPVRRFLRGRARKPLNPLQAMRTLVLAQAAALTGAVVFGWYAAQALVLLPNVDVPSVRGDLLQRLPLLAGAVLLSVAGLLAQGMCRLDGGGRDRRDDGDDDQRD